MFEFLALESPYWLTRFVILRLLGLVYFFAFLSLVKQVIPLLGKNGLTPATLYLSQLKKQFKNKTEAVWNVPTIFWFGCSDSLLLFFAWSGVLLSFIVLIGYANVFILLALWIIYLSFVHIGQVWYGYGWESELLETGFVALFLVPLFDPSPFSSFQAPVIVIWLLLWLTFRLHIGSGLIKLRADRCWKQGTCLFYHFETQPIPNPCSPYFHFLPKTLLKIGVWYTHIIQLVVPWFLLIPGWPRVIAGIFLLLFQITLMISGNLSFLNLISIVAIIAAFNDTFLQFVMPDVIIKKAAEAATLQSTAVPYAAWIFAGVVVILSIPVVKNLCSRYQYMNTSFNQFHLVNTYGAFGSVGKVRQELVVKGTTDAKITEKTVWKEYEFIAKPTNVKRKLPIIAPYQPRIDWQIWFAAMQTPFENPWLIHFLWKLLHNDKRALSLIAENPFPKQPPKHVMIDLYRYEFAPLKSTDVWKREYIGTWVGPFDKKRLEPYVRAILGKS